MAESEGTQYLTSDLINPQTLEKSPLPSDENPSQAYSEINEPLLESQLLVLLIFGPTWTRSWEVLAIQKASRPGSSVQV